MNKKIILSLVCLMALGSAAQATTISINNWDKANYAENADFTVGTGSIGAGSYAASNWNNVGDASSGVTSTGVALVDDSGAATSAKFTASIAAFWAGYADETPSSDDIRMNNSYFSGARSGDPRTITVSGLNSVFGVGKEYKVVVYMRGTDVGVTNRAFQYTVSDGTTSQDLYNKWSNTTFDGTYSETTYATAAEADAGSTLTNYGVFDAGFTGDSVTLSAYSGGGNNAYRVAIAGIQIVEVPEPATMSLLALGGVAMLRRRKK